MKMKKYLTKTKKFSTTGNSKQHF